jgi:hypothetical protein
MIQPKTRVRFLRRPVIAAVLAALAVTPLAAQRPDVDHPAKTVARFLELSEQQRLDWRELRSATAAEIEPRAAALADAETELERLLGTDGPDPAALGGLLLEIRTLRRQIQRLRHQATTDFEALLGVDQRRRLEAVRQAARLAPVVPAFRALGLL